MGLAVFGCGSAVAATAKILARVVFNKSCAAPIVIAGAAVAMELSCLRMSRARWLHIMLLPYAFCALGAAPAPAALITAFVVCLLLLPQAYFGTGRRAIYVHA